MPGKGRKAVLVCGYVFALFLFLLVGCCRSLLRYPAAAPGEVPLDAARLGEVMNPFLLTTLTSSRLTIEIDWVAGSKPPARAVTALEKLVRKYNPPEREVRVIVDQEIPLAEWKRFETDQGPVPGLFEQYLSRDPRAPGEEVFYVLSVPEAGGHFGYSSEVTIEHSGRPVYLSFLVVSTNAARREAVLWITAEKIQQSTLLHEFGHPLGLVLNPTHENANLGFHCTETECLMTHPTGRVILSNFWRGLFLGKLPWDYCRKCQEDIRRAQQYWNAQAAVDPAFGDRLLHKRELEDWTQGAWGRLGRWDTEGALAAARRVRELNPTATSATEIEALALLARGDLLAGVAAAQRYAAAKGREEGNLLRLAQALCRWGRYQAAYGLLLPEGSGTQRAAWVGAGLAQALAGLGRIEEAGRVAAEGGNLESAVQYLRRAGKIEEAERVLSKARAEARQSFLVQAHLSLEAARLAAARGQTERWRAMKAEAIRTLTDAADRNRGILKALSLEARGAIEAATSDCPAALRSLEAAEALRSDAAAGSLRGLRLSPLALCGKVEGFLAEWRRLSPLEQLRQDPCGAEDFAALRSNPRFKAQFPECSSAGTTAVPGGP